MKKNNNINNEAIITITNPKIFFSLKESKAKRIKCFYFQNIIIDSNIMKQLMSFSLDKIDTLYFIQCYFKDLNILSTINYCSNLGFVNCGLYVQDIEYLLGWIKDWEHLETLDLSGNKLGLDENEFLIWLNFNLWNKVFIDNLILEGNNFSEDFEDKFIEHNETYKSFNEIIF